MPEDVVYCIGSREVKKASYTRCDVGDGQIEALLITEESLRKSYENYKREIIYSLETVQAEDYHKDVIFFGGPIAMNIQTKYLMKLKKETLLCKILMA